MLLLDPAIEKLLVFALLKNVYHPTCGRALLASVHHRGMWFNNTDLEEEEEKRKA